MSGIIKRIGNIIRANMAPANPNYLDSQRDLFTKKYEALVDRKNKQNAIVNNCASKENAWDNLIQQKEREMSRYGQNHLSARAKEAMESLLTQAKSAKTLVAQERSMQADTLNLIVDQLSQVEAVLIRLRSVDYSLAIQKSIREKSLALNTSSSMETHVDAFDMAELNRELRRVEYTTQALIELGAK